MKKILILLSLSTIIGLLNACATSSDPADAYKNETAQQIYDRGVQAMHDNSYSEATRRFEALDVQYPFGQNTENAQLYLIYAYYMREEYALSLAAADHFLRMHPASPHADYAYFMRGLDEYYQNLGIFEKLFIVDMAKRDLTQIEKAYNDFNQVITRYPTSHYTPAAHQFMVYLRNVLADNQLHIAEYYYEHKAYVASADRAAWLVAHYQGAPQTVDGLVLMVKSYHQLGMKKLEEDTLAVLKYNYPSRPIDYDTDVGVVIIN